MQIFGQNWPSAHHLILKLIHPHIYLSAMQKESPNEIYKRYIVLSISISQQVGQNKMLSLTHTRTRKHASRREESERMEAEDPH